jgi:hypothetical protein
MAIVVPIVSEFADKGIVAAQAGFTNFKNKVAEADGAMGKFKAGAGAALDTVKANAGQFAAAAGAALAGFAVKAIGDFQELALAADKFANATGLSVQQASALIEVAGDLNIETDILQKTINKMNLAIAKNSDEFAALGIEVARNDKGLIDSNETFIRTVGALSDVQDSAERTRLATAVFGKSWGDMSEIITNGAPALRAAISSVSGAKIIDPKEVERAKELRAAQDALRDAFEAVTIWVGGKLVPVLTAVLEKAEQFGALIFDGPVGKGLDMFGKGVRVVADALNPLDSVMAGVNRISDSTASVWERGYGALQTMGGVIPGVGTALDSLGGWLFGTKKNFADLYDETELLSKAWAKNAMAASETRYAGLRLANAIRELDDDTNGLIDTFDALLDQFDREEAIDGLKESFSEFQGTVLKALGEATPQAAAEANQAMRSLVREMAQVAKQAQLTSEEQVKIVALLEKGQYDAAYQELMRQLAAVPRQIPIEFIGSVSGIPVPADQTPSETTGRGTTNPVVPTPPNQVIRAPGVGVIPLPIIGRYSDTPNVIVNVMGSVQTENDLVESIRKGLVNAQRSGKGLVYSNT